jgi:uncharacterized protein
VTKYVVFYVTGDISKAPVHFPAHEAYYQGFVEKETLLMIGTFANPVEEGSMAIFTTRQAAEEFVANDPFVLNGVVGSWHLREWNEVLA